MAGNDTEGTAETITTAENPAADDIRAIVRQILREELAAAREAESQASPASSNAAPDAGAQASGESSYSHNRTPAGAPRHARAGAPFIVACPSILRLCILAHAMTMLVAFRLRST